MEKINQWLQNIPALLSSRTSIFIYLFLSGYFSCHLRDHSLVQGNDAK
ncbi:hypothetical protein NB640_04705 [Oxalobacter vibrioformis]|uniref:Uncharacterized protein n=1 Tax=Oxalobacter vibrioformis TaxID=933080 RepID=A0A9E9M0J7_9BURK|nr:hypothetical protein [Oxalobacter vibrioformis]WAW10942.1 hypothetical protein NB640_04705 [Oxalobacter vibrioformis]